VDMIFFDLDGTLIDPKIGITPSLQYALRRLKRRVPHEDELRWCIGPPLRSSLVKILGDNSLADKAVSLSRGHFSETGIYESTCWCAIAIRPSMSRWASSSAARLSSA
jgi:phosphoglycolate phosphatase